MFLGLVSLLGRYLFWSFDMRKYGQASIHITYIVTSNKRKFDYAQNCDFRSQKKEVACSISLGGVVFGRL